MEYRPDLLQRARQCWENGSTFREDRDRCKRFTYGDQWSDEIDMGNGVRQEGQVMREKGRMPLKNNLIRRLVRNVLGVFRNRYTLPVCRARDSAESVTAHTMQQLLRYNAEINRMKEVYARSMEEFLISGLVVHKKWYGRKGDRVDCWTDFVQPDNFFVDSAGRDFRGWDISLIGELHEMDIDELISAFADTYEEAVRLRRLYPESEKGIRQFGGKWGQSSTPCSGGFLHPGVSGRCRVIEIWVREHPVRWRCHNRSSGEIYKIEAEDYIPHPDVEARWMIDDEWHWYFLTPGGVVIDSGRSPYSHGRHPYIHKAYPFIDGEVHSFVSDIIDQQKYTNRLISMYDWIMQASAKGVLLLPEGALPKNVSLDDIADEWSRFDGVIVFKPRAGDPLPQQISSKAVDIGISELLNIQMKMMEDISGVNGALQGKLDSTSMSGTLYNQQTRNSLTALADLMLCFEDFICEATGIDASNIAQFYSGRRIERISGRGKGFERDGWFNCDENDFSFELERVNG